MAETFDAAWLRQRRAADKAARSSELVDELGQWAVAPQPLRVLDLGAGEGANVAYMAPRLPGSQHWWLLDHDPDLLAGAVAETTQITGVTAESVVMDLAAIDAGRVADCDVVTASALLDLAGAAWLEDLVAATAARGVALLFALNYNGEMDWSPGLAADDLARDLFNAHQRQDKGLGAAMGPNAPALATAICRRHGYRVERRASAWTVGAADGALQSALLDGCHAAAREQDPTRAPELDEWAAERRRYIRQGESSVLVGHDDLLALPP